MGGFLESFDVYSDHKTILWDLFNGERAGFAYDNGMFDVQPKRSLIKELPQGI